MFHDVRSLSMKVGWPPGWTMGLALAEKVRIETSTSSTPLRPRILSPGTISARMRATSEQIVFEQDIFDLGQKLQKWLGSRSLGHEIYVCLRRQRGEDAIPQTLGPCHTAVSHPQSRPGRVILILCRGILARRAWAGRATAKRAWCPCVRSPRLTSQTRRVPPLLRPRAEAQAVRWSFSPRSFRSWRSTVAMPPMAVSQSMASCSTSQE